MAASLKITPLSHNVKIKDCSTYIQLYSAYEQCLPKKIPVSCSLHLKLQIPPGTIAALFPDPSLAVNGLSLPPQVLGPDSSDKALAVTITSHLQSLRLDAGRRIARLVVLPIVSYNIITSHGSPEPLPMPPLPEGVPARAESAQAQPPTPYASDQ